MQLPLRRFHIKNAPLLFTNKDQLSAGTKKGLIDLKTKNVIIVGGTPAVSKNTENQIAKLGISVKRLSGARDMPQPQKWRVK